MSGTEATIINRLNTFFLMVFNGRRAKKAARNLVVPRIPAKPKPVVHFEAYQEAAKLAGRAISRETFEYRLGHWNNLIELIENSGGDTIKAVQGLGQLMEQSRAEHEKSGLPPARSNFYAKEIEHLLSRVTDQMIMAEELRASGKLDSHSAKGAPTKMFPAAVWNASYSAWLERYWPQLPPEIQHEMIRRILTD